MGDRNRSSREDQTTLAKVQVGFACTVAALRLDGLLRRRIMDMGIIPGTTVECIRKGPAGDPTAYSVRGTTIALRKEDAAKINVYPV
ncbi:FeoA family protein [Syntrophobotulus glycolicus DSM 8271]|uniref:FeoA family protein n=1 Tax=Syntrophobotulus glycolicus (strain DSM 8271 / FlGlyR) TaxID=645991 RepID=F0SZ58_SYNGF|nr:FeoA family protein [Syntrophobotulus glycolicus]ADY57176.1 FeoA family protein [Syntrophobotulus glycolicus DSM 8271]